MLCALLSAGMRFLRTALSDQDSVEALLGRWIVAGAGGTGHRRRKGRWGLGAVIDEDRYGKSRAVARLATGGLFQRIGPAGRGQRRTSTS